MDREDLVFTERGRTLTAAISTEIDHHCARRLRERIDERIFLSKPEVLVLDFSGVRFMDSSGIALILGRVDRAGAVGASVYLVGLSPSLLKLVRLSGLDRIRNLTVATSG